MISVQLLWFLLFKVHLCYIFLSFRVILVGCNLKGDRRSVFKAVQVKKCVVLIKTQSTEGEKEYFVLSIATSCSFWFNIKLVYYSWCTVIFHSTISLLYSTIFTHFWTICVTEPAVKCQCCTTLLFPNDALSPLSVASQGIKCRSLCCC